MKKLKPWNWRQLRMKIARIRRKRLQLFGKAILLDPQNVNLYVDFANLCSAHDSFQVGIDVVSDGIGQLPKAVPLYLARGVLYVQLAQYEKAEADFETAHTLDPRQSLSSAAQGLLAVQEDDVNRALATVQAKLAQRPKDAPLLYLQADFLSQKGVEPGTAEFQLAMRSAKEAVALAAQLERCPNSFGKTVSAGREISGSHRTVPEGVGPKSEGSDGAISLDPGSPEDGR